MKYVDLIKNTFIGCQLTDDEIRMARKNSDLIIKHFDKGQFLHLEGEKCLSLEILLIGSIVSMQIDEYGTELVINTFESYEIIAGNILFGTMAKYPLSFFSETKGTLLQVNKLFLFDLFIKKPNVLKQFLILISDRAISLGDKIRLAKRKPLRNNIMEYLYSQSLFQGSSIITLPISKTELANRFGVQRTSVSREFSRMERDELIKLNNKMIEIVNRL